MSDSSVRAASITAVTVTRFWAGGRDALREHQQDGTPVFAFFNNDPEGVAVRNALTLRR
jgi:hypothetical protein